MTESGSIHQEKLSFAKSFPLSTRILDHTGWFFVAAVLAAIPLAGGGAVFALAPFCLWTLLAVLRIERPCLDYQLIPPLTSSHLLPALGTGLGLPLLVVAGATEESVSSFPLVQLAYLLAFPFAVLGYWLGGFRKFPGFPSSPLKLANHCPALLPGAWIWLGGTMAFFILRVLLGWDGRGSAQPSLKPWSSFPVEPGHLMGLFPSLIFPGFFFVPLLWKKSRGRGRVLLGALLSTFFAFAVSTGARGDVVYPALFILAGTFFFRSRDHAGWEKLFTGFLLATLLFGFAGLVLRAVYRQSGAASHSPAQRWTALSDFLRRPDPALFRNEVIPFCRSLHPWFDERIFHQTPHRRARLDLSADYQPPDVPYQGWRGFEAVPLTYVPQLLAPHKPSLLDSETIFRDYATRDEVFWTFQRGEPLGRGSILSPQADAYRRFGWWGIPPAVFLIFLAYGALSRWMLALGTGVSLWHWGLLAFTLSFFMARPMVTLLHSWWILAYHIPKQLLFLGIACLLVSRAVARGNRKQPAPAP